MVAANRAVKLAPDYPRAHAARALASHWIGDVDGALAACKRAIELKADYPEAYCVRGVVLSEAAGRHEEALANLGHALQLKPDYYQVLQVRGDVFVAMGRYEEAIAEFTRALEMMPLFQDAWTSRGSLFVKLGRYRDASQDFDFLIYLKAFSAAAEGYAELSEALFKEFGESEEPGYTGKHGGPVGDADEIQEENIVARVLSMPREKLPALAKLIDDLERASGETTGRAPVEPRPDRSPEMVAAMVRDSILGRLDEKFEKQLREIELPEGGFTTIEQAKAGWALDKTFRDLQKRREKLRLPPMEKPDRVTEAASMAGQYYAHHNETGEFVPPRPRGRPRKVVQPESAPAT
jgi:tetratricopeptide (TPR) repeat protein